MRSTAMAGIAAVLALGVGFPTVKINAAWAREADAQVSRGNGHDDNEQPGHDDDNDDDGGGNPGHGRFGVCRGLHGAGFGLCVAFCEAGRCQIRNRPGCDVLRRLFHRFTGQSTFPCELTPTPTQTAAATATSTSAATSTDTPAPTNTSTPAATNTVTAAPTDTNVPTATDTPIASTPTATNTELAAATATATGTGTAAATVTDTPAATATDTAAPIATATSTSAAATATATNTVAPATATNTAAAPTSTSTPADTATVTPTATIQPTPTGTPIACPLDAGRYTITTTGGTLRVATFAPFAFPAGGTTIQDVGAGDANCVHQTVVPYPGGLTVPVFCVPALGATTSVTQSGCGVGLIDSNGGSDFTVTEHGDTSEATVCNVPQAVCPASGPAPDSSGRLDITVGDGTADTCSSGGTANAIVTIPVNTLTWVAADGSCPDSDGTYNPGTDTLLAQFPQTLDLTTDTNTAQFADISGDGCAKSGLGPTGPFSNTGQCIDLVANTVNIAASGTIFSSGGPTYDLLFTTVQNNTISAPAPSGGATCASPPLINFNGSATRCLVGP